MSTKTSLYFLSLDAEPERGMHVYREMHDNCIHLSLYRAHSEINIILSPEHWEILQAALKPAP